MTLEEAIDQLVTLGESDPLDIARKVAERHGMEWLLAELQMDAERIVAGMAQRRLGVVRRHAELALRPDNPATQQDIKVVKVWVPESGWKVAADLTTDDLLVKAAWYERLAGASLMRAGWYRKVAGFMLEEGVITLGRLKRDLPPLTGGELEAA